ncbi:MAG: hypothetical protein ACYCOU_02435 [Sulfobacillus sp.]
MDDSAWWIVLAVVSIVILIGYAMRWRPDWGRIQRGGAIAEWASTGNSIPAFARAECENLPPTSYACKTSNVPGYMHPQYLLDPGDQICGGPKYPPIR